MVCKTRRNSDVNVIDIFSASQQELNEAVGSYYLVYDGKGITPGAYKWLANWGASYRPLEDAAINIAFQYRSKMSVPLMKMNLDPGTDHIGAFMLVNISAGYNIIKKESYTVRALASAYNLFDRRWQTFVHYPMMGRFLSAGFQVTFR